MERAGDRHDAIAARESRGAPRKRLAIPIVLQPVGKKRFHTMLRDLSLSGFSASAPFRIATGTICALTLPDRLAMQARVVWWEGGLVGCMFDESIGQVTYDAILEHWQAHESHR